MSLSNGILGFLLYDSMTGYDLAKAFNSSVRFFWHAQNSHIYLELNKLENKGYVSCEHIVQNDKPNKKLYSITDSGKKEFFKWLEENNNENQKRKDAFLMKIFFSGNLKPDKSIKILKEFIKDCDTYCKSMSDIPDNIEKYKGNIDHYKVLYWKFTADFGNRYIKMCIDWANNCIKELESLEKTDI